MQASLIIIFVFLYLHVLFTVWHTSCVESKEALRVTWRFKTDHKCEHVCLSVIESAECFTHCGASVLSSPVLIGLTLNDWCCARWMLPLCKHYIHEWTRGVPLQCHSQGAAYLLSPLLHLEEHTFNGWSPLLLLWPSPSSSHPCLSAASSSSLSSWITVNWLLSDLWLVRPRLCDQLPLVLLVSDCHKFLLCRLARICRIAERGGSETRVSDGRYPQGVKPLQFSANNVIFALAEVSLKALNLHKEELWPKIELGDCHQQ